MCKAALELIVCVGTIVSVQLHPQPSVNSPSHDLKDVVQEVQKNHKKWLAENRHMKYLWIPYTDSVVVVKNNPVPEVSLVSQHKALQVVQLTVHFVSILRLQMIV